MGFQGLQSLQYDLDDREAPGQMQPLNSTKSQSEMNRSQFLLVCIIWAQIPLSCVWVSEGRVVIEQQKGLRAQWIQHWERSLTGKKWKTTALCLLKIQWIRYSSAVKSSVVVVKPQKVFHNAGPRSQVCGRVLKKAEQNTAVCWLDDRLYSLKQKWEEK